MAFDIRILVRRDCIGMMTFVVCVGSLLLVEFVDGKHKLWKTCGPKRIEPAKNIVATNRKTFKFLFLKGFLEANIENYDCFGKTYIQKKSEGI